MPNLLDDSVVDGHGEADNVAVSEWATEKRLVGDKYRWHDELAAGLGGLDLEAAARISGARFAVLYGPLARLERAISQYFIDTHIQRGYLEVSTPLLVSRSTLQGTGQLPKFEDDLFQVNHTIGGEKAYLIPTAEVPLTSLYREQILSHQELPLSLVASTPCFRAEAGSHGRDTRGLLRQHQFHKVELVKITTPEDSEKEHEAMVQDAEYLLQQLELPYRKVQLCSGDIGFAARLCYDLEVWLPGQQTYREISSISNCHDFQARRMQLRYRPAEGKKPVLCHTLNGSGLAVGRTIVAILENYQRPDGSVGIPQVLQPYMNGLTELSPSSRHDHVRARRSRHQESSKP
jgi:seryl-tRNA synthetase